LPHHFFKKQKTARRRHHGKPHEAGKRTHHAVKQLARMLGPIFPLVGPIAAIFASEIVLT
jgi:hypothetical protein